jgi:hypothetical protein
MEKSLSVISIIGISELEHWSRPLPGGDVPPEVRLAPPAKAQYLLIYVISLSFSLFGRGTVKYSSSGEPTIEADIEEILLCQDPISVIQVEIHG